MKRSIRPEMCLYLAAAVSLLGCPRAEAPGPETPPGPALASEAGDGGGQHRASAVSSEPEAAPLGEIPRRLSLDVDVEYEHGCSQSHEGITTSASLVLEIERGREAILRWELDEIRSFGPSLGRFQQGDRDFSASHRRVQRVWRGPVERSPDGLVVRFVEAANASAERGDAGRPVLPEPTVVRSVSVLTCRPGAVQAYDAATEPISRWQTDGQTATPLPVYLCTMSETLFDREQEVTVGGAFPLAADPGLHVDASIFFGEPRVIYRRAAPPAAD